MVLKREQFNLERIATKNTIKVLRFLTSKPYLSFGLTELSELLKISKSNVLRILEVLRGYNLIIEQKSGKKKLFRINSEMSININIEAKIKILEEKIVREGERIWLI